MINITFKCDKYGDHTAPLELLIDEMTKRFENDEEFEAAAFVDECTVYPEIYSDLDLMGILVKKQSIDVAIFQAQLFEEEEL
jgi:hypothetical protein